MSQRRDDHDLFKALLTGLAVSTVLSSLDERQNRAIGRILLFGSLYLSGALMLIGAFSFDHTPAGQLGCLAWAGIALWVGIARTIGRRRAAAQAATDAEQAVVDAERVWVKSWRPDGRRTPSMIMTRGEARTLGLEVDAPYVPQPQPTQAPANCHPSCRNGAHAHGVIRRA